MIFIMVIKLRINKQDITLKGTINTGYGIYPKECLYKNQKCRRIKICSRAIFLYKPLNLVFKIGDRRQNIDEFYNWKKICKKYPHYKQYFAQVYRLIDVENYNICVQQYIKCNKHISYY